jgi:hypothetical protein
MVTKKKSPKSKKSKPKIEIPLTDKQWLETTPLESEVEKNAIGRLHIPIEKLRPLLDRLNVQTKNYQWHVYRDERGDFCAGGSMELTATIDGRDRTVVGAYNLTLAYAINGFWNGTLKSECVKNAAAELGARLGRGLNKDLPEENIIPAIQVNGRLKPKPDEKILQQYNDAKILGDKDSMEMLENIFDFSNLNGNVTKE